MAQSKDVEPTSTAPPRAFQRFTQQMAQEAELSASFSDADKALITEQVVERMLMANSLEEAIAAQDAGMPSGQTIMDLEHEVVGFEVVKSDKPDAPLGHYLRVQAIALHEFTNEGFSVQPGEEFTYAIGAPNPVTLLIKARGDDRLPIEIVLRGKKTDGGTLLLLRLVPKRATK